jgi:cytoskeletal protein CcmA (bactofilin family)
VQAERIVISEKAIADDLYGGEIILEERARVKNVYGNSIYIEEGARVTGDIEYSDECSIEDGAQINNEPKKVKKLPHLNK